MENGHHYVVKKRLTLLGFFLFLFVVLTYTVIAVAILWGMFMILHQPEYLITTNLDKKLVWFFQICLLIVFVLVSINTLVFNVYVSFKKMRNVLNLDRVIYKQYSKHIEKLRRYKPDWGKYGSYFIKFKNYFSFDNGYSYKSDRDKTIDVVNIVHELTKFTNERLGLKHCFVKYFKDNKKDCFEIFYEWFSIALIYKKDSYAFVVCNESDIPVVIDNGFLKLFVENFLATNCIDITILDIHGSFQPNKQEMLSCDKNYRYYDYRIN